FADGDGGGIAATAGSRRKHGRRLLRHDAGSYPRLSGRRRCLEWPSGGLSRLPQRCNPPRPTWHAICPKRLRPIGTTAPAPGTGVRQVANNARPPPARAWATGPEPGGRACREKFSGRVGVGELTPRHHGTLARSAELFEHKAKPHGPRAFIDRGPC